MEAENVEAHIARSGVADHLFIFLLLRMRPFFGEVFPLLGLEHLDELGAGKFMPDPTCGAASAAMPGFSFLELVASFSLSTCSVQSGLIRCRSKHNHVAMFAS